MEVRHARDREAVGSRQLRVLKCLSRLQDEERLSLLDFAEPVTCGQGMVLFEEGDAGDCMYLILEVQMRVFTQKKGQAVTLKLLEAGDAFGDIALFHHTPRRRAWMRCATASCSSLRLPGWKS